MTKKNQTALHAIKGDRKSYEMDIVTKIFNHMDNNNYEGAEKEINELRPRGALKGVTKKK